MLFCVQTDSSCFVTMNSVTLVAMIKPEHSLTYRQTSGVGVE